MNYIIEKINSHQFLDCNDISKIVYLISNGKVKASFSEYVNGACYDVATKNIQFNNKIEKKEKQICLKSCEIKIEEKNVKNTFLVDLYNIRILHIIFHELEHYLQYNPVLNSSKNKLFAQNIKHFNQSCRIYDSYHSLYYIEYNADINAFKKTLNFIKRYCSDLDKNSIVKYNNIYACYIGYGYGNKYIRDGKYISKINDRKLFHSPIGFYNFLSKLLDNKQEQIKVKNNIKNLKLYSINEYIKLLNGFKLSKGTMQYIDDVSVGKKKTTNLLEDIKNKKYIKQK